MDIEKVKRYSLIEAVLLAIFALGLLIAAIIVKQRTRVELSEPTILDGAGLAVFLPDNPDWRRTPSWQYEQSEDCMTLVGKFRSQVHGSIEVRWRYYFVTPPGTEKELLKSQARRVGAEIKEFDSAGENRKMVYAKMISGSTPKEEYYMGLMRLDFDRSVELLVQSRGMSHIYEEDIFLSLANKVQYQMPVEVADGRTFLDSLVKLGLHNAPLNGMVDEAYLIKDPVGSVLGYYFARHSLYIDQGKRLRRVQIRYADKSTYNMESTLCFEPDEKEFHWETSVRYPGNKESQTYKIEHDDNGHILITSNVEGTQSLWINRLVLPEPLLTQAAVNFLKTEYRSVVIDVFSGSGQLVPVRLENISPLQAKAKSESTAFVVRLNYLHHEDSYEDLLLDESLNLLGKYEQLSRRRIRIWDAVTPNELEQFFQVDFDEMMDEASLNACSRTDKIQGLL